MFQCLLSCLCLWQCNGIRSCFWQPEIARRTSVSWAVMGVRRVLWQKIIPVVIPNCVFSSELLHCRICHSQYSSLCCATIKRGYWPVNSVSNLGVFIRGWGESWTLEFLLQFPGSGEVSSIQCCSWSAVCLVTWGFSWPSCCLCFEGWHLLCRWNESSKKFKVWQLLSCLLAQMVSWIITRLNLEGF